MSKENDTIKRKHLQGFEKLGFMEIRELVENYINSKTDYHPIPTVKTSSITIPTVEPVFPEGSKGIPSTLTIPTVKQNVTSTVDVDSRHSSFDSQREMNQYPPRKEKSPSNFVIYIIMYIIDMIIKASGKNNNYFNRDTQALYLSKEKFLVNLFKHPLQVDKALEYAVGSGILKKFECTPGLLASQYQINNQLPLGKIVSYPIYDEKIIRQINHYWAEYKTQKPQDAVTSKSEEILKNLQIDARQARNLIQESYEKDFAAIKHKYIRQSTLDDDNEMYYPLRCRIAIALMKANINPNYDKRPFKRPRRLKTEARLRLVARRDASLAFVEQVVHIEDNAYCGRDEFGRRLTSLLTRSPRLLRQFLSFKYCTDDLHIIDMSNAQPLLMLIPLIEYFREDVWKDKGYEFSTVPELVSLLKFHRKYPDVLEYIQLVQNNLFYENMFIWLIEYRFLQMLPFVESANKYRFKKDKTTDETLKIIAMLHKNLPMIRKMLTFDPECRLNQKVGERLNVFRRQNLDNPKIIDDHFVSDLIVAVTTPADADFNEYWHKKIKQDCAHHIFYGLAWGQSLRDRRDNIIWDEKGRVILKKHLHELEQVFMAKFPNVNNFIQMVKNPKYKLMSKELQGLESRIFIDGVLNELIVTQGKKNVLSIHDGIVCTTRDVELVKSSIEKTIKQWGIQVPIKIENLSNPDSPVVTVMLNKIASNHKMPWNNIVVKGEMKRFAA